MTQRRLFLTIFGLLATAAAAVFLAISIDSEIYAPGAHDGGKEAAVLGAVARHVPARFQHDLEPRFVLRKIYSVIAFAVVGGLSAPLFARADRIRTCATLVTGFSLAIEIVQRLTVSHESNLSSIFDLGCGALGGAIGGALWNLASARLRARRNL